MSAGDTLTDILASARNGLGQVGDGLRNMKAKAADGFDKVVDKIKPAMGTAGEAVAGGAEKVAGKLRGAAAKAPVDLTGAGEFWKAGQGATAAPAAPGVGATVQAAVDSTKPAAPAAPIKSPLDPRFADPLADSNAKMRTMNNPVLDVDAVQQKIATGNQRFDQFHPQQPAQTVEQLRAAAAQTNTPQARAAYSGLDNTTGKGAAIARGGARLLAGAPLVMEGANVAQTAMNPNATGTDVMREGARGLLRGGLGTLGAMGGAALGSLVTPVAGTIAGGTMGGYLGTEAGDYIANRLVGAPRDLRGAPAAPGMVNELAPKPSPESVDPMRQQGVRSDQVMSGSSSATGGDVLNGRRLGWDDPQYVDQVRKNLGLRGAQAAPSHRGFYLKPGEDPNTATRPGRPTPGEGWSKNIGGGVRAMARVRAAEAYEQGNINERKLGQRDRELDIQAGKAGLEETKIRDDRRIKNQETFNKTIDAFADSTTPEDAGSSMIPGMSRRGDYVKRRAESLRSDIEFSVANRKDGRHIGDLSPTEQQQLIQASRIKDAYAAKGRDYFGDSFNSRDLYSYIPSSARQTATGRWEITMANGNKALVTEVAGGGFNWTKGNDPIQSDLLEMIKGVTKKGSK